MPLIISAAEVERRMKAAALIHCDSSRSLCQRRSMAYPKPPPWATQKRRRQRLWSFLHHRAGLVTLALLSLLVFLPLCTCRMGLSLGFVRLRLMRSSALLLLSQIVGWVYFVAWSVSFYPQLVLNFRRKSVYGLNFDFLALNLTGFICYSIYTCSLYWPSAAQKGYFAANPRGTNPVQLNDVFFTLHAVAITLFTICQCIVYERRGQRVSKTCWGILGVLWSVFIASLICAIAQVGHMSWFCFVSIVSYLKIAVTLIKYIPQAVQNWRRKSTVGWSIGNVLLDLTGGSMSIAQMFLQSWNFNDWNEVFLDPTKFWLGALSILFDSVFIVQHYFLYRHPRSPSYRDMAEEEEEEPAAESIYGAVEDPADITVQNPATDDF